MGRPFILHYDEIPDDDCINCFICGTRVGFIGDLHATSILSWVFHNVFNVEVPEDKRYHQVEEDGRTVADTYCIKCGNLLGWKVIAIVKPSMFIREGVFIIRLSQIDPNNQDEGANEQVPNDEQGGTNE
ncbi:hypothetical protein KY285_028330 [Solanum tuberosum]|nr:hypothetical protein KY289_028460 [Solanum tuberosum]KAH0667124.1 hypothetical protein KY285_028330 [Solanum tuberosum]